MYETKCLSGLSIDWDNYKQHSVNIEMRQAKTIYYKNKFDTNIDIILSRQYTFPVITPQLHGSEAEGSKKHVLAYALAPQPHFHAVVNKITRKIY